MSSFGESRFALESPEPHRLAFDLDRVLRTEYRSDCFQKSYFVIDGLPHLLDLLTDRDFGALCAAADGEADIDPTTVGPDDRLAADMA